MPFSEFTLLRIFRRFVVKLADFVCHHFFILVAQVVVEPGTRSTGTKIFNKLYNLPAHINMYLFL